MPFPSLSPPPFGLIWLLGLMLAAPFSVAVSNVAAGDMTKPESAAGLLQTDIMGVFAHPDDETGMAGTLAYYALGKHAAVANVYCTRGEGGGNMVGTQAGAALGVLREAELRSCLNILGVRSCYFLDQLDWAYTESASATLRKWGHERTLEKLVRLVRALCPEVIVTMNPAPTPGQHGHHQVAGILATEAFSAAADPNRFPLQLTKEGLSVWQPRKLYYSGGSSNGILAIINVTEPLTNGETPAQVAARALAHHRSQAFGNFGNSPWLQRPQNFTLVKSFAGDARTGADLLKGLPIQHMEEFHFAKPVAPLIALDFVPRPAVSAYRRWVGEQGIEHVAAQLATDLPVMMGETNVVKLLLANHGAAAFQGEVRFKGPPDWHVHPERQTLRVGPGQSALVQVQVIPPTSAGSDVNLSAAVTTSDSEIATTALAHPLPKARVAYLASVPALDGSDRGWETVQALQIAPTQVFEGKVTNPADSSAVFRLAHDGKTLFIDVQVKDDVVVSNIAPNDIRGHWRSDSVEICLDPDGGAEDTMRCYKLGIFPFDSSGVVRAARDADANQGPIEETGPKTRLASRRLADGYRIQAAIPFEEIGLPKGATNRIGFNLIVYDGDKPDAAPGENINKSRIAWAPREGVMGRPEDWGRLDLEPAPRQGRVQDGKRDAIEAH